VSESPIDSRGSEAALAALRRLSMLVADGASAGEVFGAIAREAAVLLDAGTAVVWRNDGDGDGGPTRAGATVIASWGPRAEAYGPGTRWPADGLGGHVCAPIVVDGAQWGAMSVDGAGEALNARIADFTDLVAATFSTTARQETLTRLADEQAALRRVATLVARECEPAEVFAAVAEEVARLLDAGDAAMLRFESPDEATVVAISGSLRSTVPIGTPLPVAGMSVTAIVRDTGAPARIDDYDDGVSGLGEQMRQLGVRSAIGVPVVVDERLWGAMIVAQSEPGALPADTEARVAQFTSLISTALSNVQARADLAASRARIVHAADDERRRVVKELHDGAQQRLVHAVVQLKLALRAIEDGDAAGPAGSPAELVADALEQAERATQEIRELAHGMLPTVLTRGGLRSAVDALASQMSVAVVVDIVAGRLPAAVEATAYLVVSESLANVAKHARASRVDVLAVVDGDALRLTVRDDGAGGAAVVDGGGLVGLRDRLAAVDGRLAIGSPPGGGTEIVATIPMGGAPA
jgi:signal transduction histidine kinase